ncbi:unnamed protein product [Calypogeia fissa]
MESGGMMRVSRLCWLLLSCAALQQMVLLALGAPESARITSLPGFTSDGPFPSAHYGGYIPVNEATGKQLYYYFVTSESKTAATDPVVLWLNGGPGCSSFDGFIYEHGPFNFELAEDASGIPKLSLNPYSWSKVANIIYLDSPAGVGLSYSNNKSDYLTGDLKTEADSYIFLKKWFAEYPEYLSNPFYIAGESYAGIYVPTLSRSVANGIAAGDTPKLNFKGYTVGNGCTDDEFDGNAFVPFVFGMGLIPFDLFKEAQTACHGNYWNDTSLACIDAQNHIYDDVADINIYDILEPCYHSSGGSDKSHSPSRLPMSFRRLGEKKGPMPVRKRMFGRAFPLRLAVKEGRVPTWNELQSDVEVPCTDDHVATRWLNTASVREALHAAPAEEIGEWQLCTDQLIFYRDAGSMLPIHYDLTQKGYKALIFSGDHDMCVPYTGSEAWTKAMGYEVVDEWRPWFVGRQVAGFTQAYANKLTFATVKGSGHTVPEYKPEEALAFFSRWLTDKPL